MYSNLKYTNILPNRFEATKIFDNLFLGNIDSSYDYNELKRLGITHIVSVIQGYVPPFPNDFEYLVINAMDDENTNIMEVFDDAVRFIEEGMENGKVLVHCFAGRSRSATIVLAYIIKKFGMDVEKSLKFLKGCRDIVQPNKYFMEQLNKYYDKLYK
ncbi:dual specificity protein phosphatase family protein [bacterium]|nr:dual specificity protein phosphatase family protein [bacterium]